MTSMSSKGETGTVVKSVRVSTELWQAVAEKAEQEGTTGTDVIRALLLDYVNTPTEAWTPRGGLTPLAGSADPTGRGGDRRSAAYRASKGDQAPEE